MTYDPNDKDRAVVRAMAGYGVPQHDIAKVLHIHDDTLRKYYHQELATAETETSAQVAHSLFLNATQHNNVAAQIFWLKTRARWKETPIEVDVTVLEDTGPSVRRLLTAKLLIEGKAEEP